MKINVNGITRDMTPEEESRFAQEMERLAAEMPKPEPNSEDEWKQMIEAALLEIGSILGGA